MNKTTRDRVLALVAVVAVLAMGAGVWWLLDRMAVASLRHALNHPEGTKDTLWLEVSAGCSQVNGGRVWIGEDSPRYVRDRLAASNGVYRYIVVDSAVFSDASCLSTLLTSAWRAKYPVSISVSNNGFEAANFHFTPGGK